MQERPIYRPYRGELSSAFVRILAAVIVTALLVGICVAIIIANQDFGARGWAISAVTLAILGYVIWRAQRLASALGVYVRGRNLLARQTANEFEVPIASAIAEVITVPRELNWAPGRTVTFNAILGDQVTAKLGNSVPTMTVLVIHDGDECWRLEVLKGMSERKMRVLADTINHELTARRDHYNYPEPVRRD